MERLSLRRIGESSSSLGETHMISIAAGAVKTHLDNPKAQEKLAKHEEALALLS
jgi:hypothetical protein